MKIPTILVSMTALFLGSVTPAFAGVLLYAEGPAFASVGSEVAIHLKARLTEPINAVKVTVAVSPDSNTVGRFDDTDSAVRLWLQRGTPVSGGILLEGVIPGGIGPAFTDSIDLGTVWVEPGVQGTLHVAFQDSEVYLNQPTPTLADVRSTEFTLQVGPSGTGKEHPADEAAVLDADVRIVQEPALADGARSVMFDIKTDRGTVDTVRIRERWLGLFGTWREISSPSTLSDSWGVSILEVALSDSQGGVHVASVIPLLLKVVWGVLALCMFAAATRYLKQRH